MAHPLRGESCMCVGCVLIGYQIMEAVRESVCVCVLCSAGLSLAVTWLSSSTTS